MQTDLEKKAYNAQCIGNVQPIEYMIPYPSMRSLIEGQTIKFSEQIVIQEANITNEQFFSYVQQASNWLENIGLNPKERLMLPNLGHPQTEILLYGIWNLGSSAVLDPDGVIDKLKIKYKVRNIIDPATNLFNELNKHDKIFEPKYKPLLYDEAIISFEKQHGIRLSHYNLLINASGLQKGIDLNSRSRFCCNIEFGTSCWVVLTAVLPIYSGCIYDRIKPNLTFGYSKSDYVLRSDLRYIKSYNQNEIAMCAENSAVLSVGNKPIHLTSYKTFNRFIKIKGHSVMLGYLDDKINQRSYTSRGLNIPY